MRQSTLLSSRLLDHIAAGNSDHPVRAATDGDSFSNSASVWSWTATGNVAAAHHHQHGHGQSGSADSEDSRYDVFRNSEMAFIASVPRTSSMLIPVQANVPETFLSAITGDIAGCLGPGDA